MTAAPKSPTVTDLTRPIIGIENRTALEVFDIMSDRIRHRLAASTPGADCNGHVPNRYVPELPEGASLFAVNPATGAWHYVNHAGSWQSMPSPLVPAAVERGEVAREAVNTDSLLDMAMLRIRRAQAEPAVSEHLAIALDLLSALPRDGGKA